MAQTFNQPLSFDTSRVTNMHKMFQNAYKFNQLPSFDTSSVTTMRYMFKAARAFNQPLSWNTSLVTTMNEMFHVSCSPRPAPQSAVAPSHLHAACTAIARRLPHPGQQLAPHRICPFL